MGLKKWGFLETVTCLDIDVLDGWHFHGIEGLETTVDVLTRILLPRSSRTAAVHSLVRLLCATLFVPTVCPCFWSVHSEHVKTYGFWVPNFVKKIGDSKKELSDVVCSDIYLLIVHSFIRESLLVYWEMYWFRMFVVAGLLRLLCRLVQATQWILFLSPLQEVSSFASST